MISVKPVSWKGQPAKTARLPRCPLLGQSAMGGVWAQVRFPQ